MKMQMSTAKRLFVQLQTDILAAENGQDEIELSPLSESLILDTIARDQLQAEINKQEGE